jgi:nicotinate phosphoribosyltransferase
LARRKHAPGKDTLPGRKQVWRRYQPDGRMAGDTVSLENDEQDGEALIHQVMRGGKRVSLPQTFDEIRKHAACELQSLPAPLRELEPGATYPVQVGKALTDAAAEFDIRLTEQQREP